MWWRIVAWWRGWRYHWQHDARPEPGRGCEHGEDTWRDGVTRCYACNPGMFEREWLPRTPQLGDALWASSKLDGYSMLNSSPMTAELARARRRLPDAGTREQMLAELSPEALDLPQGPQAAASWGISPGPGGGVSSLAPGPGERLCGPGQPHEKPAGTESAGPGHLALTVALPGPGVGDGTEWAVNAASPYGERLADTADIADAGLLAEVTAYMRDQDADVADWLAGRAMTWARLEIGALT